MKEIQLTQGQVALVDDEDYELLNCFNWHAIKRNRTFYARREIIINGNKRKSSKMHREIINVPNGLVIDHIDGNGLNNQKFNLRIVTNRQNMQNRHSPASSKYPGVCWNKEKYKWEASATLNRKHIFLGFYSLEIDAFRAYYDFILSIGETILDFPYPSK